MDACVYWIKHSELEELRKARLSALLEGSESTDSEEEGSESEGSESDSSDSNCVWTMTHGSVNARMELYNEVDYVVEYPEGTKQQVIDSLRYMLESVENS